METAAPHGDNSPSVSVVMFATLCSNPQLKKQNMHQNVMMSFATSFFVRKPHHTARQTSTLQRMPRKSSGKNGMLIFVAAAPAIAAAVAPEPASDSQYMSETMMEPTRLPT